MKFRGKELENKYSVPDYLLIRALSVYSGSDPFFDGDQKQLENEVNRLQESLNDATERLNEIKTRKDHTKQWLESIGFDFSVLDEPASEDPNADKTISLSR